MTPRARVTADDLEWAATWLDYYDPGDDPNDEAAAAIQRVAAMLRADADKRRTAALVRATARDYRLTPEQAARVVARATEEGLPLP